jgi:hypothetical protein
MLLLLGLPVIHNRTAANSDVLGRSCSHTPTLTASISNRMTTVPDVQTSDATNNVANRCQLKGDLILKPTSTIDVWMSMPRG